MAITVVAGTSGIGSVAIAAGTYVQATICTTPNVANTMYIVHITWAGSVAACTAGLFVGGVGHINSTTAAMAPLVIKAGPNQAIVVTFGDVGATGGTVYWSYNSVGITVT